LITFVVCLKTFFVTIFLRFMNLIEAIIF
jgi:hypothetical protein